MRKKYKTKKKLKIKNILILLASIGVVAFGLNKSSQEKFTIEESVSAETSENINNKSEEKEDTTVYPVAQEIKKSRFTIVVDASYGGSDGGSKGYNGILQKNVNLDIALKIKDILERHEDMTVILTRSDDTTISMSERAEIINNSNADFVVSIMQNTEGSGQATGIETYVLPSDNEKRNSTLGYVVQKAVTMYVDTKDRGVLSRNMDILLKSNAPGIVVNTGFISSKEEGTNLTNEKYQLRVAEGISQGILSYIDRYEKQ